MEEGSGADEIRLALEVDAALGLHVLQLVDCREVPVDQHRVAERPEVLGRLQFGREGGEEEQVHVLGHAKLGTGVPAGAIQHEHDLFGGTGASSTGKGRQLDLEERDGDAGSEMPPRATRGGMDEADEIAPLIAVLHRRDRTFSVEAPDLLEDGLQPDAMLVRGPELDLRSGEGGRDGLDKRPQFFLNSACCAASAWTWRGRGFRHLPSRRTR